MSTARLDLTGILNVNKPEHWTSHDVVARIRRLAGQKRVGHAGTLDPMAEGVLPVLLGRATRLAELIQSSQKTYSATVRLGVATDTDDATGTVVSKSPVAPLPERIVMDTLSRFHGDIVQLPPKYSALKVAGHRAYALARSGADVALSPRPVTIYDLRLVDLSATELRVEVTCSKGTYVRALARDIAVALGTVGHLSSLKRTRVGAFSLDDSLRLEEVEALGVGNVLLPADQACPGAPRVCAEAQQAQSLANGQPVACDIPRADAVWVYDPDSRLICLASADGVHLKPRIAL